MRQRQRFNWHYSKPYRGKHPFPNIEVPKHFKTYIYTYLWECDDDRNIAVYRTSTTLYLWGLSVTIHTYTNKKIEDKGPSIRSGVGTGQLPRKSSKNYMEEK